MIDDAMLGDAGRSGLAGRGGRRIVSSGSVRETGGPGRASTPPTPMAHETLGDLVAALRDGTSEAAGATSS